MNRSLSWGLPASPASLSVFASPGFMPKTFRLWRNWMVSVKVITSLGPALIRSVAARPQFAVLSGSDRTRTREPVRDRTFKKQKLEAKARPGLERESLFVLILPGTEHRHHFF